MFIIFFCYLHHVLFPCSKIQIINGLKGQIVQQLLVTRRHQEETPISEPNYNQDTVQKEEFPIALQIVHQKEELIRWLIKKLLEAKQVCEELHETNNFQIETHLDKLKKIIDCSLEKAHQHQENQSQSVGDFDINDEVSQQGTPYTPQDLLTGQAAELCSKEANEPSCKYSKQLLVHEDDQEQRKGSEQYRQAGLNKERKQHQQQQQIQSTMSANEDPQQPFNIQDLDIYNQHQQLKERYRLAIQRKMAKLENIKQQVASLNEQKQLIRQFILEKFASYKDLVQNIANKLIERSKQHELLSQSWQKKFMDLSDKQSASKEAGQNDNQNKQVKNLNKQILELNQKILLQDQKIASQSQTYLDLQKRLNQKDSEIENQQNLLEELQENSNSQQERLKNRISELERELQMNQLRGDPQISQILADQGQRQSQILSTQQNVNASLGQFPNLNEKLDYIKKAINGDFENKIKELKDENQFLRHQNEQLKQEVNQLKLTIQRNDQVAILNQKNEELKQKDKLILEQSMKLQQQSSEMENFKKTLSEIDEYIKLQHTNRKMKYEEEYESILATHLEGYQKLLEKSIPFIFVGLTIYKQFLMSESRDVRNINRALETLTRYLTFLKRKDNFNLKDRNSLQQYYSKLQKELNDLYDEILQSYQTLINELKQRNN